jgi:hypothetical protein
MKILKIAALSLVILGVSIWIWQWHRNRVQTNSFTARPDDGESYPHKLNRYRVDADQAVRKGITNQVVGLRQIISQRADTSDENFMKWTATATVEFINPVGGVDRTNLDFKFDAWAGQLECLAK